LYVFLLKKWVVLARMHLYGSCLLERPRLMPLGCSFFW
jgi:hypothetical protein